MKFALDTNTISYALRGDGRVKATLNTIPVSDVGIPAICTFESLRGGLARSFGVRRLRELETFLQRFQEVPFDAKAADHAARISDHLTRAGAVIGALDVLIAGTARANALTLVTRNRTEFARVPGLATVDWY